MKKITYQELYSKMVQFNKENNVTCKGNGDKELRAVIVFTEDSFENEYTLDERSYEVTNHNKRFIVDNLGNSLFGNCLDGVDLGVRLDWYMADSWEVDYCYIVEQ